ncbi:Cyclin-A1-1 [Bienertia sinuspersici]
MATQSHRRSLGSLAPAAAKRHAAALSENAGAKVTTSANLGKKRPPLNNLTNQRHGSVGSAPSIVPCTASKSIKAKKGHATSLNNTNFPRNSIPPLVNPKAKAVVPLKTSLPSSDAVSSFKAKSPNSKVVLSQTSVSSSMDISPGPSDAQSLSMESISTCESLKSPEVEYLDGNDVAELSSIERKTSDKLHISDHMETSVNFCKREILADMEVDKVVNIDGNHIDPQFCTTIACDIYKHLRESETLKRPSADFMEKIQKDINASMRAILVDWLVEVAEEYRLVPDTLYLTINYIDRYLSGNAMNRQRLQLLGVACMMIAAKYEEICAPQVEEFCYITDNTYFKDEVLQMESSVLNFLKFEMTATTTKCFLRRFVRAAQVTSEAPSMQLDCLSNYIAELSLLEYNMVQYAPSLTAASAIFLAKYILNPSQNPWNTTLKHYTLYESSDLHNCVIALHQLCLSSHSSGLPAIREKYSQHKYKFVAKKYCPPSIPQEYFCSMSS